METYDPAQPEPEDAPRRYTRPWWQWPPVLALALALTLGMVLFVLSVIL